MKFTNKEKVNAEMAMRYFCKEAEEAERGISPLYIYMKRKQTKEKGILFVVFMNMII